jgi:hypothetical protein
MRPLPLLEQGLIEKRGTSQLVLKQNLARRYWTQCRAMVLRAQNVAAI